MTNAAALSPAERNRLVGILGRLGSDHDGERAAAGLLASRMLRAAGLGWSDVILAGSGRQAGHASPGGTGSAPGWLADMALCRKHQAALTDWEARFAASLQDRRGLPTMRQAAKLRQVADALRARGLE